MSALANPSFFPPGIWKSTATCVLSSRWNRRGQRGGRGGSLRLSPRSCDLVPAQLGTGRSPRRRRRLCSCRITGTPASLEGLARGCHLLPETRKDTECPVLGYGSCARALNSEWALGRSRMQRGTGRSPGSSCGFL